MSRNEAGKNFDLSREDFESLRTGLREGDDRLFSRIFLSQFQETQRYLIRHDKAGEPEAYDATMEALLNLREGLIRGKINYGNLRFLFTRMARQEYFRDRKRQPTDLPVPEGSELDWREEDDQLTEEDYRKLARGWKMLSPDCRELLRSIFYLRLTAEEVARTLEVAAATIRKRKQRCTERLRKVVV